MKETLRQSIARLASECDNLRNQLSLRTTERDFLKAQRDKQSAQLDELIAENNTLRAKLSDADHRTRKLIAQTNRQHSDSERRAQMAAAREAAMKTGRTVLVGEY